jgi:hypothetical protein
MPFINFSVSEDLKEAFNATFRGRNKSAIIAQLMRDAIEAERDDERSSRAIDAIRMMRATAQFGEDGGAARPTPRRRR